ncbi:MAG: DinB family protein [Acidobacteria bacterium]|nr:DinB family protein [Acidobacteriota bacterium]MCA1642384.1 DinB family protein [Acidobacteriota bacterium]
MTYNSIEEVFAANEEVRRRLVERAEGLSEEQQGARGADGGWSAADIIEHLSLTERRITRALEGMLPQAAEGEGGEGKTNNFTPFSLDAYIERASGEKFEAPEYIRPRGASLTESLAHLKESRTALAGLRPRFDVADFTAQFPHPAFGPLNLAQWLAFIGIHEERHLRQLERNIETMK